MKTWTETINLTNERGVCVKDGYYIVKMIKDSVDLPHGSKYVGVCYPDADKVAGHVYEYNDGKKKSYYLI